MVNPYQFDPLRSEELEDVICSGEGCEIENSHKSEDE